MQQNNSNNRNCVSVKLIAIKQLKKKETLLINLISQSNKANTVRGILQ